MAGRPTKLTPAIQKIIVDALTAGNYADTAATLAGIAEKTFYEWVNRGDEGESPYAEFSKATKEATATAERTALETARAGATGAATSPGPHWTSAMTFLERRFPSKWGKRDPDHGLKTKLLEAELETLKAKLKLLEAGTNPDDKKLEITFRDYTKNPDAG